ncbi:TAXI family TRAP transporter solute-binding subunit [Nocardiopsis ansamitocini]|uniref:C4-dicarboxylate ABC transporter substrate-binding protein n=1 Tax=Nocardiopsis ansamitocini TaxID=1670832 RepID=A0A9W6P8J7_9ACTN|nr:TAXI family TRAP transporter solute-binding subunit [Nocardiopsis ansamitocini]GLU49140.1 C4-dicarboxylate ABC transporter substrate-binding protein [Nocardiopsis ansamitocini]
MLERPGLTRRAALLGGLAVLSGCASDTVVDPAELILATGPPGAVFREIGAALAGVLATRLTQTRVRSVETGASADNLRMLSRNQAQLGFASLDAVVGENATPPPWARSLGRVYDSHLHLVVLAGSPVEEYADLAGRVVSLGAEGSGTEFTCERLIRLTGLGIDDVRLDQAESARALVDGEIDALFSLTGIPTPAIEALARDHDVRFIPLEEQATDLVDTYPGPYIPATVPSTAYPGVPPCRTVAIPNLLLCRADLAPEVGAIVTETVFTQSSVIAADRPEAAHINVRTGIATGPVPLHPGAQTWFRAAKK